MDMIMSVVPVADRHVPSHPGDEGIRGCSGGAAVAPLEVYADGVLSPAD